MAFVKTCIFNSFLIVCRWSDKFEGNLSNMSRELFRTQYRQISRKNGWTCPPHPLQGVAWFFILYFSFINFTTLVPHLHSDVQIPAYIVSFKILKSKFIYLDLSCNACTDLNWIYVPVYMHVLDLID